LDTEQPVIAAIGDTDRTHHTLESLNAMPAGGEKVRPAEAAPKL